MAHLRVVSGPIARKLHPLKGDTLVLGRHPDCGLMVDAAAVSRRHAQIAIVDEKYLVEDLGSRNGTYVNESRIEERWSLAHNDLIRICDVVFRFESDAIATAEFDSSVDFAGGMSSSAGPEPILFDDDESKPKSSIMSKLDVSIGSEVRLSASTDVKLQAILELNRALGKSLSLDEVLPHVLESLFKIFVQADRGFIFMQTDGGQLVPRWSKYRREDTTAARISRTVLRYVIETKEAILSADACDDTRFEMAESITDFSIRSMMCAPLVDSEDNVLGALQIDTLDQRNRFREEDLEVLVAISQQATLAIVNAQLHDQALEQRDIKRDMELARTVQKSLLPSHQPEHNGYKFYDFYQAANLIGGDYYDYVELSDGRLAILVADVSGHGIAAALIMAKLSAEARFCLASNSKPSDVVTRLNRVMSGALEEGFVTMVLMVLQPTTGELSIVNAGHQPPVRRNAAGELSNLGESCSGLPLGVDATWVFECATETIQTGDIVTMYTDGLTEAMDTACDQYGTDRLHRQISESTTEIQEFGAALLEDVRHFTSGTTQNDDMCVVCVQRL